MKGIKLSFFTVAKDIIDLIKQVTNEYSLYAYVCPGISKERQIITVADMDITSIEQGNCIFILSVEKVQETHYISTEFVNSHPNVLYIKMGNYYIDDVLEESYMYTLRSLNNEDIAKIWLKIANKIKRNTINGGYVRKLNRFTSTKAGFARRSTQYTKTAYDLYFDGVKMKEII